MEIQKVSKTTAKIITPQPATEELVDVNKIVEDIKVLDEKILHYQNMRKERQGLLVEIGKVGVKIPTTK